MRGLWAAAAIMVGLGGACDGGSIDDEAVDLRPGGGGIRYDTSILGGFEFSEVDTEFGAHKITGLKYADGPDWLACIHVGVKDGKFVCVDKDGKPRSGAALKGSKWTFEVDGEPLTLTLEALEYEGGRGLWRHRFVSPSDGPLCADDPDAPGTFWALAQADIHLDQATGEVSEAPGVMRLACTSGATGKAGDPLGWLDHELGAADYEASLRALRLDACGDGQARISTAAAAAMAVQDTFGVHTFGPGASTKSEGVYGRDGMICSGQLRRDGAPLKSPIQCGDGRLIPICSESELAAIFAQSGSAVWVKPL